MEPGKTAPNFSLQDQSGQTHSLSDYKGKFLVIYFYPRDNTPGCTKESCAFRDHISEFTDLNCSILGVSADSATSHEKFIAKFSLNFPLLVDEEKEMLQAYGAWGEKNNYGKKYMGIIRSTVIIAPDGNILKHWETVRGAEDHPIKVLEALKELQA
ncbi:thioredoxin-dependent thiol peroxidase [Lentisphaera profundi]|uniref:thioredoxin-dependent peroxiredoxin n=1 Tax=Lentisphaera profundi TaxID=1658616 RepID=A0ABY7VVM5_9BACT|nr:thioredoxin-dependent thiol peroxidase [Lentisphaera profundi]WDE96789.1 thioredoxin-dependent thiol peroxidase [Lentisphaera profundi]